MKNRGALRWSAWAAALAAPLLLGLPGAVRAQDDQGVEWEDYEYEPGEGLHEEEWYDPSDWFDFDEGVEYEQDDWSYYDYDWGGYDTWYDGYDEGWYDDGYVYDDTWYDDEYWYEDEDWYDPYVYDDLWYYDDHYVYDGDYDAWYERGTWDDYYTSDDWFGGEWSDRLTHEEAR